MRRKGFAGREHFQPLEVRFDGAEETVEPAVAEAMIVGVRPGAEFFHVVAHGSHAARMIACRLAKERNRIVDAAEGDR